MKKEAGKPKGSEGKGEVFGSSSSDKPTASIAVKRKASGGDASSKKLAADGKSSVAANWAFAVLCELNLAHFQLSYMWAQIRHVCTRYDERNKYNYIVNAYS